MNENPTTGAAGSLEADPTPEEARLAEIDLRQEEATENDPDACLQAARERRAQAILNLRQAEAAYIEACKVEFAWADNEQRDEWWRRWWRQEAITHRGYPLYKGRQEGAGRPEDYEGEPHPSWLSSV